MGGQGLMLRKSEIRKHVGGACRKKTEVETRKGKAKQRDWISKEINVLRYSHHL